MALPLPAGLLPPEIAFLCEMELVTIIPRQRLESLQLLGGPTPVLRPPHRADLPLWLALLLKRQRRASIVPPPWLHTASLTSILEHELSDLNPETFSAPAPLPSQPNPHPHTSNGSSNSNDTYPPYLQSYAPTPPFQLSNTASAPSTNLPYHFLELGQTLLSAASDDIPDAEKVRQLLRDLREVRMAKVRSAVNRLHGGAGVNMTGIGALELGEGREFLGKVVNGLRKIGASREREEREAQEERRRGLAGGGGGEDDDEDMEL